MIHITKCKGGYMNVALAKNGEVLVTSEVLSSKAKCFKNVKALIHCVVEKPWVGLLVQDDTIPSLPTYYVTTTYKQKFKRKPEKKYQPGKNK